MTLAFITSLRHPQNSADYDRVEALLADTLASISRQTDDDWIAIVVGNRRPRFDLDPRVRFVEVDFPAPAPPSDARTSRQAVIWDKGTKLGVGLVAARDADPEYVMLFDADDFVHRSLVRYTTASPGRPGWLVTDGYVYSRARGVLRRQEGFSGVCGTSAIVPFTAYGVPQDLTTSATQQEIADAFGERLHLVIGAHRTAEAWFAEHGRQLRPLPFPGAVYHVDTGENHSGKALQGLARPLPARIAREFGIPRSRGPVRAALTNCTPDAVAHTVRDLRDRVAWRAAALRHGAAA